MLKPFDIITLSIFSCYYFGACFRPYTNVTSLQNLCFSPEITKLLGCFMYISSSKSPFRKAVLSSVWCISKSLNAATAIRILIEVILVTVEQVSKKSRPSFCLNHYTTSLALCLSTQPSLFNLVLNSHLEPS